MKNRKTALITGASRGIGRGIAEALSSDFDLYLICHKNMKMMDDLPGRHYCGDIGDYDFVRSVFDDIAGLDVLINNAGISKTGLLQDMKRSEWDEIVSSNLSSIYNTCHLASGIMVRQHSGKIINISSQWGNVGASMEVAYSATKGGMNAFTKALAKELAPSNVQVNAIACGVIDTDMNRCYSSAELLSLKEEIPSERMGTPADVGDLVLSLLNTSDYLTGQIIALDGGWI